MSNIHLEQIKRRINADYNSLIKVSLSKKKDQDNVLFSRGLAAFSISSLANISPKEAVSSIVDGSDDNGIDAIHYDEHDKTLYIVQSKWIHSGKGEPLASEIESFCIGIRDLMNLDFEKFNKAVSLKSTMLNTVLGDPRSKYVAILVYPSVDGLAKHAQRRIDKLLKEINDSGEILTFKVLKQDSLYKFLVKDKGFGQLDQQITLYSYGKIETPYQAFYGQIKASDVLALWNQFGSNLFNKNIRGILGDTEVNNEIIDTLKLQPQHFWYFNNGITLIAKSVLRTGKGASDKEFINLSCQDFSVVNGAQTVSSIARSGLSDKDLENATVLCRVLSINDEDFSNTVTKTNNRQNRIESRDFVSSDLIQSKIKTELSLEGIDYHIIRSSSFAKASTSFDFVEAATAMACSIAVSYAVQAKREVSKLWDDTKKPPYVSLFNPSTNSFYVWKVVLIQRMCEELILKNTKNKKSRHQGVLIHGNRVLFFLILRELKLRKEQSFTEKLSDEEIKNVNKLFLELSEKMIKHVEKSYKGAMLPTLFKNAKKCEALVKLIN